VLFSTMTPLVFMGEEYDEPAPFRYFTDHDDPAIAAATRRGRREEFAGFEGFSADQIPDPQSADTYQSSVLTLRGPDPFYAELIALHRELPRELDVAARGRVLTMRRGSCTLVADFDAVTVELHR
jgi:maltooligosyltrehalose trehalohydrolase